MGESTARGALALRLASMLAAAAICAAILAAPAEARAPEPSGPAPRAPLPIPEGFLLQASHGYELHAFVGPALKGSGSSLNLIATAEGRQVTYRAPATVTETSIRADLGELGKVSIDFRRSNEAAEAPCGERTIRYDSGSWVGTIDFRGEEEYTAVEATSAPGDLSYFLSFCELGVSGGSGRARGADLHVRNPGLGASLDVYKSRPGAAAVVIARLSEYTDEIAIERTRAILMPGHDFSYDRRLRRADVTPPAPFSGSAHFDLDAKAGRRWSGDLTVDMPGRGDVPLTDPILRATLSPA